MKESIRKKFIMLQAVALLLCVTIAAGAGGAAETFAASYGEYFSVTVPYTHIYDAEASRAGDVFAYEVVPQDGAPAPEGSKDGVYRFKVKAEASGKPVSGQISMKIAFRAPGEYHYKVMADAGKAKGVTYESRVYTLNVYVQTGKDGNVECMVTAVGEDGRKYERLQFNPSYDPEGMPQRPTTTPDGDGGDNPPTNPPGGPGGNPGNGTPGDGTPADGTPTGGTPADGGGPLAEILDNVVPKAAPDRQFCSLINIIITILTVLIALILTARYCGRIDTEEDEYIIRRGGTWRLTAIFPALIAAITLICVEDMSIPKKWMTDEWTGFLAGMLVICLAIVAIVIMKYDREYNDTGDLNPGI